MTFVETNVLMNRERLNSNLLNWNYDKKIPSEASAGSQVIQLFVTRLQEFDWSEKNIFGVHVAIEEAVMNAIKHGNQFRQEKWVHIVAHITGSEFSMRVTDEGDGFNPDAVPDPTLDENLEEGSGRGLMLMRHYMDEVKYNQQGNSVAIRKKIVDMPE